MAKKPVIITLTLAALAIAGMCAYAQEDITVVEDTAFGDAMRPPVSFNHDEHNDIAGIDDCGVCHHVYDEAGNLVEGETSEDMECGECHAADAEGFPMQLVRAYHLNCRGCHEAQKAGPVVCAECHKAE